MDEKVPAQKIGERLKRVMGTGKKNTGISQRWMEINAICQWITKGRIWGSAWNEDVSMRTKVLDKGPTSKEAAREERKEENSIAIAYEHTRTTGIAGMGVPKTEGECGKTLKDMTLNTQGRKQESSRSEHDEYEIRQENLGGGNDTSCDVDEEMQIWGQ